MKAILAFVTFSLISSLANSQDIECDPASVELIGAEIFVDPGDDDRSNLQCALNEAVRLGVQKVKLARGTFTLSDAVGIEGFQGQIEGTSRTNTIIEAEGFYAFVFVGGAPSIKFMSIVDVTSSDTIAIAFLSNAEECSSRTVFGEVDRVDFVSTDSGGNTAAVLAARDAACPADLPLLGKLTLNRVTTTGFPVGAFVEMKAGAIVTLSNNDFAGAQTCLLANESNADISFINNDCEVSGVAVIAQNTEGTVSGNQIRLQGNNIVSSNANNPGGSTACAWLLGSSQTAVSAVLSNNRCEVNGDVDANGLLFADINGAIVTGNVFRGASDGVRLINADETFISSNTFQNSIINADIRIDSDSDGTIIGSQNASLLDEGTNTQLLP